MKKTLFIIVATCVCCFVALPLFAEKPYEGIELDAALQSLPSTTFLLKSYQNLKPVPE